MPGFASLSRRTRLWAGFAAVLLPLLILLVLQYVWLHRLERLSAIAERAVLGNYLETIGADVEYYYRSLAERALNIPASTFKEKRLDRAATFWSKKPVTGARRLFLVDYTRERFGNYLLYDDARGTLLTPPASDEALAIIVACAPWQVLSYRGTAAPTLALRVDERNPDYRIVLNPITDETSHLVGVAGMILDEERFRTEILPGAIRKALPDFMPDAYGDRLAVTVRDGLGHVVFGAPDEPGRGKGVTMRVPFAF